MLLSRGLGEAEWVVSVRTASVCNANGIVNKVIKKSHRSGDFLGGGLRVRFRTDNDNSAWLIAAHRV